MKRGSPSSPQEFPVPKRPLQSLQEDVPFIDNNSLYQHAHGVICRRLENFNIPTDRVSTQIVRNIFKEYDIAGKDLIEASNIMNNNIIVSDAVLLKHLKLKKYPVLKRSSSKDLWFYIRTRKISTVDFNSIINSFVEEDTYASIINKWISMKEKHKEQEHFYLRYIGMCKHPTTPSKRYNDDIKSRANGFMTNFFKRVYEINPSIIGTHSTLLTLDQQIVIQDASEIDLQEQVLVSLFGLDNLLNSQPGGFNQLYSPGSDFKDIYFSRKIKFFNEFQTHYEKYNTEKTEEIAKDIAEWTDYVVELQKSLGSFRNESLHKKFYYDFNTRYKETITKQATPIGSVKGLLLLAFIGHDITYSSFQTGDFFYDPSCGRASFLLSDFLMRLKAWECNEEKWVGERLLHFVGKIPFINLIPWMEDKKRP